MFYIMASDKSVILKTFNTQVIAFIDDVIKILPDKEIIKSKQVLESIKFAKPSLIIQIWFSFIEKPYHEDIEKGDPSFFLEKDYTQDLSQMPNAEKIMNVINTSLREPLSKMDDVNKNHCCNYIKVLSRLSKAYDDLS